MNGTYLRAKAELMTIFWSSIQLNFKGELCCPLGEDKAPVFFKSNAQELCYIRWWATYLIEILNCQKGPDCVNCCNIKYTLYCEGIKSECEC